jgi:hypothetical protein
MAGIEEDPMTTTNPVRDEHVTPVEAQRARLEEADDGFMPEEEIGTTLGAVTGGAIGALIGALIAAAVGFDGFLRAVPLILGCTVVAGGLGALIGILAVARPARRARSEFARMRATARREPPAGA